MKTDESSKTDPVTEKSKNEIEKKARNEGVKKGIVTTSIFSFIILLVAGLIAFLLYTNEHKKLINMMETQKTALTYKVTARDSVISEWITTFDDIEKNIAMIKEKEKVITMNSSNSEIPKDKKIKVLEDIKYINTLLDQNEASMKQNENEISELKTSLVNKKFEVEQLNTQMVVLQDTISMKNEKISDQTNELNKAFYVCGTYKELKAKGLLTKEGGFIGLGKTESLTGNFPDNSFVQIDITKTTSISVDAKSAKLITEHPAGSYEFIRDKDKKIQSIEIKDPALFWKVSKYAVLEITK
jgi:hypothetical protein